MINQTLDRISNDLEEWLIEVLSKAIKRDSKEEIVEKYLENKTYNYKIWNCFGNRLIIHNVDIEKSAKVIYLPMKENNIRIDIAGELPLYMKVIEKTLNYIDKENE